jgi:benzoyl-CoA reductase subunit B
MTATKINTERLACTRSASDYQKNWFKEFRRRAIENGEPYVIADGAAPMELCHVMDIPVVSTVWYSAIISAKKLSPRYFDLADTLGYHRGLARYVSLPLFSTLDNDPETAAYGGLPKPMMILSRFRGDYSQRIFQQWADAYGVPHYGLDCSSVEHIGDRWWEQNEYNWEQFFETHRVDHQVKQLEGLIQVMEILSGRTFDFNELATQMHRINQAGEITKQISDSLAAADRLAVAIPDQLHNVMAPTWHRGSQWSVDHLTQYQAEVQERIDSGYAICEDERARLIWINNGLWHDTSFYRSFEEKYGAVFVWSMYTNFFADGYRRYFTDDPLRALAARHLTVNEQLHLPGYMNSWVAEQARNYRADGAVMILSDGDRSQSTASSFTRLELERIGIPVLELRANVVDERLWDGPRMSELTSRFIEDRVLPGKRR